MGMLGDWGAHIIDYPLDKLDMGLPTKLASLGMDDHNQVYYPVASRISMHFPARGKNRPAIDISESGTRREELLLDKKELELVYRLRKVLSEMNIVESVELLKSRLAKHRTNAEFLMSLNID